MGVQSSLYGLRRAEEDQAGLPCVFLGSQQPLAGVVQGQRDCPGLQFPSFMSLHTGSLWGLAPERPQQGPWPPVHTAEMEQTHGSGPGLLGQVAQGAGPGQQDCVLPGQAAWGGESGGTQSLKQGELERVPVSSLLSGQSLLSGVPAVSVSPWWCPPRRQGCSSVRDPSSNTGSSHTGRAAAVPLSPPPSPAPSSPPPPLPILPCPLPFPLLPPPSHPPLPPTPPPHSFSSSPFLWCWVHTPSYMQDMCSTTEPHL